MIEYRIGDKIKGYTIESICGNGSFGAVYQVSDILGNRCALKLITGAVHCRIEIQALIRYHSCRHPNLLTVLHIDRLDDGRYFYTMDLADGLLNEDAYTPDSLQARLEKWGKIPPDETEKIIRELLAGLSALHQAHLLHRDIKPGNILFVKKQAVLADIGLVTGRQDASVRGTPGFLSRDLLASGRLMSETDDLYALGKVLYCMLTGEAPEKFPSTPGTLRTAQEQRLMAVAETVCTGQVKTAQEFLELLDGGIVPKQRRFFRKMLWTSVIFFLMTAVCVALVQKCDTAVSGNSRFPAKRNSAHEQVLPYGTIVPSSVAGMKVHNPQVLALLNKYRLSSDEEERLDKAMAIYEEISGRYEAATKKEGYAGQEQRRVFRAEYKKALPAHMRQALSCQVLINNLCKTIEENYTEEKVLRKLEKFLKLRNEAIRSGNCSFLLRPALN